MDSRGLLGPAGGSGSATGSESVDATLARLSACLDELIEASWWQVRESALGPILAALHRAGNRIDAAATALVGQAIERGTPVTEGATSPSAWVRARVPVTPGQAARQVALASHLATEQFAATRTAFGSGDLGLSHAAVITRTMTAVPSDVADDRQRSAAQAMLVSLARQVDPAQLGVAGRRLRHRMDPQADERLARDEDAQERAREASLVQEASGMWVLHGILPPVAGACLRAALDPLAAPRPSSTDGPDPRTGRQRLADALHQLAQLSLASPTGAYGLPVRHGSPTRLVVVADLSTVLGAMRGCLATGPGAALGLGAPAAVVQTGDPHGWPISALTLETLACDAEIEPILLDDRGDPLDVGRAIYAFPRRIRRAIEQRDGCCTWRGCTRPAAYCDTHHLLPFSAGGRTSKTNGALLCGEHHRLVHRLGLLGLLEDGHVYWPDPSGRLQDPALLNPRAPALEQAFRDLARSWVPSPPADPG